MASYTDRDKYVARERALELALQHAASTNDYFTSDEVVRFAKKFEQYLIDTPESRVNRRPGDI